MDYRNENQRIEYFLQNIIKSKTFSKSPRSIRLLKFLVKKAQSGEDIKEDTLGLELFNSKYNPYKKDSKVRVYMFNLRKKLIEYYANDGIEDEIVFEIIKGQYNIRFVNNTVETNRLIRRKKNTKLVIILGSLLLISSAGLFLGIMSKSRNCWDYFFKSPLNTVCFLSDHFVVKPEVNNKYNWVTHIEGVNNEADLAKYLVENRDKKIRIPGYTFLTKMAPIVSQSLTKWFVKHNRDFEIRMESDFTYESIRENNVIFAGQHKTMGESKDFFLMNSKIFEAIDDGFIVKHDSIKIFASKLSGMTKVEYTMVSFITLGKDKEILYFTSNHDIGVMAAVSNFTNKKWLKEFYLNFPDGAKNFNALFETEGIKRTELNSKLIAIEFVEQNE